MFYHKHYIRLDADNRIIYGFSDAFENPLEDDICINEQGGYQFRLFTDGKENPSLVGGSGVHLYKWDGGNVVETNPEDHAAEQELLFPLSRRKQEKQERNKAALAAFLAAHPLTWSDGKQYGATLEDQQEMALNLIQYQAAIQAGLPATLEWHSAKSACTRWSLEDYTALTMAISAYVYPYLRRQEQLKEAIYAASTREELEAVPIDYESL